MALQLLVYMDEGTPRGPAQGHCGVPWLEGSHRAGSGVEATDIRSESRPSSIDLLDQLRDQALSSELRVSIPLDGSARCHVASPVLHYPKTVGEDGERGIGSGHARSAVRELIAQVGHNADQQIKRLVYEFQEVIIGYHLASLDAPLPAVDQPCRLRPAVLDSRLPALLGLLREADESRMAGPTGRY